MRPSHLAVAAALAAGVAAATVHTVRAGEGEPTAPAARLPADAHTLPARDYLRALLDAQLDSARRARATVDAKLADDVAERERRARAAYKVLRTGSAPAWVEPEERLATARRRTAARWLLARDRREVELLAAEAVALADAEARLVADRGAVDTIPLPPAELDVPARGAIVRRFGALRHDASKATLSRRGLDLETAERAEVRPVADGVVRYAGPIRGLDHGLVIEHAGFWTVLGKLDPPAVAAGDRVTRGQVVGRAARRRVYLEVRVPLGPGGLPIDPEPLFAQAGQTR